MKKLYDKAKELRERVNNMTLEELDENDELVEQAEKLEDELAEGIDEQLHKYERIGGDEIGAILDLIAAGEVMDGAETDGEKVFEHITKVYE